MRIVCYPEFGVEPNQYVGMLNRGLVDHGAFVSGWNERLKLSCRPNTVILHWLENKLVPKVNESAGIRSRWRARQARHEKISPVLQELAAMRAKGTKVVWVAHNRKPHRWQESQAAFVRASRPLWRQVDAVIHLTRASRSDPAFGHLRSLPSAVIPHMHYRLVAPGHHAAVAGPISRLAFVGGFSPRKKATAVIRDVLIEDWFDVVVTRAGKRDEVTASEFSMSLPASARRRMSIVDRPSDGELDAVFDGRTAAVLCDPFALNSGVMMLALSRGAPVIAPDNPVNREIQNEVGRTWLRLVGAEGCNPATLSELCKEPVAKVLPQFAGREPLTIAERAMEFLVGLDSE